MNESGRPDGGTETPLEMDPLERAKAESGYNDWMTKFGTQRASKERVFVGTTPPVKEDPRLSSPTLGQRIQACLDQGDFPVGKPLECDYPIP